MSDIYIFLISGSIFVVTYPVALILLRKCFYKSELYGISLFEKEELNEVRSFNKMVLSMVFILFQMLVGFVALVNGLYLLTVNGEIAVGLLTLLLILMYLRTLKYFSLLNIDNVGFEKYVAAGTNLPMNVIHVVNKMRILSEANLEHLKNYRQQPVIGIDHTKKPSKFPLYEELLVMNTKLSDLDGVDTTVVVEFIKENEEFTTSLIKILESESLVLKLSSIDSKDILNDLLNTLINMNSELDVILDNKYVSEDMEDSLSEIDADESMLSMFDNLDMLDMLDSLDTFDSSDYDDIYLNDMDETIESIRSSVENLRAMVEKMESNIDEL